MLPSCAVKHKKPVFTKCDGGTRCTMCCLCKPHQRPGRPRKDRSLPDTPVRASKAHHRVGSSLVSYPDPYVRNDDHMTSRT